MTGDDPLFPEIGTPAAIRDAIECVELALTQRRPAGTAATPVADGNELADVVVALAQLSATLAILAVRAVPDGSLDEVTLLRRIGRDQEIHAARRVLAETDEQWPFDA